LTFAEQVNTILLFDIFVQLQLSNRKLKYEKVLCLINVKIKTGFDERIANSIFPMETSRLENSKDDVLPAKT